MGVHAIAVEHTAKNLADRKSIVAGLTNLKQYLRPGAKITITNEQITASLGDADFNLSQIPYELDADLEALIRLERLRKL